MDNSYTELVINGAKRRDSGIDYITSWSSATLIPQVLKASPVIERFGEKPAVMPLKHLRLTGIEREERRQIRHQRQAQPPMAAFPVLHVVEVVPQPSAFEVTHGSTAINSHPTQLNVSWRDRIVVVVFDGLPKKEEERRLVWARELTCNSCFGFVLDLFSDLFCVVLFQL